VRYPAAGNVDGAHLLQHLQGAGHGGAGDVPGADLRLPDARDREPGPGDDPSGGRRRSGADDHAVRRPATRAPRWSSPAPFGQASSVAVTMRSLVSAVVRRPVLRRAHRRQRAPTRPRPVGLLPVRRAGRGTGKTLLADVVLADGQTDPVLPTWWTRPARRCRWPPTRGDRIFDGVGPSETPTSAVEVGTTAPMPGLWTLILNFAPDRHRQQAGRALQRHGGARRPVRPPPARLPDSESPRLPAGQPVTVPVTVTNTSERAAGLLHRCPPR
jgi:hypothetical protein